MLSPMTGDPCRTIVPHPGVLALDVRIFDNVATLPRRDNTRSASILGVDPRLRRRGSAITAVTGPADAIDDAASPRRRRWSPPSVSRHITDAPSVTGNTGGLSAPGSRWSTRPSLAAAPGR
jgi:hypothetical protein